MERTLSMEPLSDMWADLKEAGGIPTKGLLLSNCEAELAQLMRQIDVMVTAKRAEWQKEKQILQAKLDVREQEHDITKATLEQKHHQIGQLRGQVELNEKKQKEITDHYESQLASLKAEVSVMRREYEKLKKQYKRHARGVSIDRNKANTELEDTASELRRLNRKIEDYRRQAQEWEHERQTYEKQVEALESQHKMLQGKCELIQQQTTGYQNQLDKRRDLLDTTEISLRSQISQLEGQLSRARDAARAQESQISHWKTMLDDSVKAQRLTLDEKEKLEDSLRKNQAKSRELEKELQQRQTDVDERDSQLQHYEVTNRHLSMENSRLDQTLSDRETTLQHLDYITVREQSDLISRLKVELDTMIKENMQSRKSERHLKEEVKMLQENLEASQKDSESLRKKMTAKLEDRLVSVKKAHTAEREVVEKEVADLKVDLHHRNIAMASLSEKAAKMERQLRDQDETLQRREAEVEVANSQLEALRLESRHLRQTVLRNTSGDVNDARHQLQELQDAYSSSLAVLEKQKQTLQRELTRLQQQVDKLEDAGEYRVELALKETEQTIGTVKNTERRRMEESRSMAEQKAKSLEQQLNSTVERYESQLAQLHSETNSLRDELELRNRSLQRLGMENDVMTSFVGGVQDVVQKPPHRETSTLQNTSDLHMNGHLVAERNDGNGNHHHDEVLVPVEVVTERFLSQQEERTRELERKLDVHIEGLKANMSATIDRYRTEK